MSEHQIGFFIYFLPDPSLQFLTPISLLSHTFSSTINIKQLAVTLVVEINLLLDAAQTVARQRRFVDSVWHRAETHLRVFGLTVSCCKPAWIIHHILWLSFCLYLPLLRFHFDLCRERAGKIQHHTAHNLILLPYPLLELWLVYILSPQKSSFTFNLPWVSSAGRNPGSKIQNLNF